MRKTLKHILAEYGMTAVVVYMAIHLTVLFAAWGAIKMGFRLDGVAQNVGAFTAAYLTTKMTQPLRIAATLALTPLVVRVVDRVKLRGEAPVAPAAAEECTSATPPETAG